MITLRRAHERRHEQRGQRGRWHTFDVADPDAPFAGGFGVLVSLREERMPPGTRVPRELRRAAEVVTYVFRGSLVYDDAAGRSGTLAAGEFQRRASSPGSSHHESNASRVHWARVFRVGLRPGASPEDPGPEQRRFEVARRGDRMCAVASQDGREGSLRIQADARLYSSILQAGRHLVHEIAPGRCVWLHVVHGEVVLDRHVLATGDGAAIGAERAVSLTARVETEILLIDIEEPRRAGAAEVVRER